MKIRRTIFFVILAIFLLVLGVNIYNAIVTGNQYVVINSPNIAYSNTEFKVQTGAKETNTGDYLDSKAKIELLDNDHKKVKNVKIEYDDDVATISVPDVKTGTYYLKATISSNLGKDTVERTINISSKPLENIIITFDKGIYKPGDVVNFRALILNKVNNKPIETSANISIYDGNDNRVFVKDIESSKYGILFGSFKLGDEVNSGLYKLVIKTDKNEITKQFKVNPYVLPKYEVVVKTDKDHYLANDTVVITAEAKYFFGEPVTDADISFYVNGEAIGLGKTNIDGIATKSFKDTSITGAYTIKVEAQDSSNYYVESNADFIVGRDLIRVELLPEYGDLVVGEKNKIYVLTKDAYGTPIKTYIEATIGTYKKQVITDDNGIGSFEIDAGSAKQSIVVRAENMNGDIVIKYFDFEPIQKDVLIKTDKVKYNEGEEITLKVDTSYSSTDVYIAKGDDILKIIPNINGEAKFDLGNNFGLIDIFVKNRNGGTWNYKTRSYDDEYLLKKTIFIVPNRSLKINITTDKSEYKPGENIKLSFNTQDENGSTVDTALLVSMLDNSILNLANNDLSIDNVRLALENIKLSEDVDAATLYSAVMNDTNEQTLVGLLLKQKNKSLNINSYSLKDYSTKSDYTAIIFATIGLLILFLVIWAILFTKKVKIIVGDIFNILALFMVIICLLSFVIAFIDEVTYISYSMLSILNIVAFILSAVLAILSYIFIIGKRVRAHLTRTSIFLFVSSMFLWVISILVSKIGAWVFLIIFAVIAALIVLTILSRKNKFKNEKTANVIKTMREGIKDYLVFILGSIVWVLLFIIFTIIYAGVVSVLSYYWASMMIILLYPIAIITFYAFSWGFYKLIIKKEIETSKEKQTGLGMGIIIGVIIAVCLIVVLSLGVLLFNQASQVSSSVVDSVSALEPSYRLESYSSDGITQFAPTSTSGKSSSISSGIFGTLENSISETISAVERSSDSVSFVDDSSSFEIDEHIRNVFLESMCFVPELIAENGKADLDLTLSDNITTWTVQAIGNTKDGNVGFGKIDNVKVFKEFFADFELPKNLVKGDKVSIPVTIYNYTENTLTAYLTIKQQSWFKIASDYDTSIAINPNETKLIYIPIEVLEVGNNTFRVEVRSANNVDIIEKTCEVVPNGFKVEKVVTSGILDGDTSDDILLLDKVLDNSARARVKIYSNTISQTIEGVENILRMPSGCFEQVSSSLYPDIVALKYLRDNKLVNEELEKKALEYISAGYQKLLSYEVGLKSGGFSLYGYSPAETVLTAYGLMEFKDLEEVYDVDQKVIDRMVSYLYGRQKSDGSFNIEGYHIGGLDKRDELSENAYIIWALSEADPEDYRLTKSINYLSNRISSTEDSYTLALIANALVNVKDSNSRDAIKALIDNVIIDGDKAYIASSSRDYWGSYGTRQNVQATALLSLALSKNSSNLDINKKLINYIVSEKDCYGTWYSTQNTVLSLKALNEYKMKEIIKDQTIKIKFNDKVEEIKIEKDALDLYSIVFDNVSKENKLNIEFGEGEALYEVTLEYYKPYEDVDLSKNQIAVDVQFNNGLNVNDVMTATIALDNLSESEIANGMVVINIPQGFVVVEESLNRLVAHDLIEKYEMSYRSVNLYLRGFSTSEVKRLDVQFRASYPVNVTGLGVRAYDYYNPNVEGYALPKQILVK